MVQESVKSPWPSKVYENDAIVSNRAARSLVLAGLFVLCDVFFVRDNLPTSDPASIKEIRNEIVIVSE